MSANVIAWAFVIAGTTMIAVQLWQVAKVARIKRRDFTGYLALCHCQRSLSSSQALEVMIEDGANIVAHDGSLWATFYADKVRVFMCSDHDPDGVHFTVMDDADFLDVFANTKWFRTIGDNAILGEGVVA